MESIGTLASGVAHDFNNILGIILPNAELIKMKLGSEGPAIKFADVIINASKRAAQLTKQLLSLSRRDPHRLKVVSLNDAIRMTGRLLGETLDRCIRLEFDLTKKSSNIKADETQIEQVLLNLAINARDAMPDGGMLKFTTENRDGSIVVRVSDTGTGIDRAILSKIFDPFFTTKDKSKGTGLGLSVVYGIVKQAGGTVDVVSQLGNGAEFVLTFPSSDESAHHAAAADGAMSGGSERILIVDDEPEMLELLQTALESLGYSVAIARNGLEAVETLSKDVHLVILDMIMPVMDGLTALRAIRQKAPDMKVLISSGFTSPEKIAMLERMGVEGFVQKPYQLAKMASIVRAVLDGVTV
jgi:CheY-like chemotaxis protein